MSMLNRRTQPLDPAVLQALTGAPVTAPPPGPARSTSPLKQPEALLDALAPASARRTELPAQAPAITGALTGNLGNCNDTNARLSENEAELLLDVSAKLATAREQDPAQFQQIMDALQKLSSDASGQVDFSALSAQQQQALTSLGMNPQNTRVIFHQLYQMLLPGTQQESSQAFKKVQAQVTSFISNLDLRERTMNQIQQQASDLAAVQGVVCNLSATSIQDLLADQTASVYDLSVSKINGSNFNINNGMEYTLGHMVVLSQQSPATLQQVEGLIQKVKTDQSLDATEQGLLRRFGLNLNQENKLQTIDGKVLDYKSVNQLENVIFSMKDPSEGYQRVLQASASVIAQSHKLEQLATLAEQQSVKVQQTTQQVVQSTQNLEQLRQDTNHLDAQIKFANVKANTLVKAMDAATGLFQAVNVDPQLLSQWNIQILPGATAGTQRFIVSGKEVSRLEMLQELGRLLTQQRNEVAGIASELAHKKTQALTASAELGATTQTLEVQKADLQTTEQVIVQATDQLHKLEAEQKQVIAAEMPHLKPEEKTLVETEIVPIVAHEVQTAVKASEQAIADIHQTVAQADAAIVRAHAVQQAVADDAVVWEQDLKQADAMKLALDQKLTEGKKAESKEAPAQTAEAHDAADVTEAQPLAPGPRVQTAAAKADEAEIQAHERHQEQAKAQKRNEETFLEQTRGEHIFTEGLRHQQQVRDRAKKDQDMLDAEVKKLRD